MVDKKGQSTTKLNVTMGQLLDNKEMFIVMAIFVITTLVVYQVRRLKINNSWTVATIAGGLVQLVALVVAYLVLGLPEKIIWLVLSTVAAIFAWCCHTVYIYEFLTMHVQKMYSLRMMNIIITSRQFQRR